MRTAQIEKILSPNDVGATGAHQAGILIPKKPEVLAFFPKLDRHIANPDCWINFVDEAGNVWRFRYIWYNGKLHGTSTRNEYRLTCMTAWFRSQQAKAGDIVVIKRDENGGYKIKLRAKRKDDSATRLHKPGIIVHPDGRIVIKLGTGWKIIQMR